MNTFNPTRIARAVLATGVGGPVPSPVFLPNLYPESMMLIRRSEMLMVLVA
jgi:hypothetical protein